MDALEVMKATKGEKDWAIEPMILDILDLGTAAAYRLAKEAFTLLGEVESIYVSLGICICKVFFSCLWESVYLSFFSCPLGLAIGQR